MWDTLLDRGPWGLIALIVVSIIRGWLVPRWWHEREITRMEKRIADKEATGMIWKEIADERREQIATLMGVKDPTP